MNSFPRQRFRFFFLCVNMKFLLELMSCCGSYPAKEETRSLVVCVSPRRRARRVRGVKRGRSGRNGSSVGEWRPSLSSISEDNVLFDGKGRDQEVVAAAAGSPSARNLKRKVTSTSKARSRSDGVDAGGTSIQAMMPAFSPAPFMF